MWNRLQLNGLVGGRRRFGFGGLRDCRFAASSRYRIPFLFRYSLGNLEIMDDEFSDLFLLNDCLISGRLSPGPPDDFLGQGTHDTMLLSNGGHQTNNFLSFDVESDLTYPSDSPRRSSSIFSKQLEKTNNNNNNSNGNLSLFAFNVVKSEEASSSGRSPDHDYVNDVKMEGVADSSETGAGSRGGVTICSSETAASKYCHGIDDDRDDDNDGATATATYDVDDYYHSPPIKTTKANNGDVSSSRTTLVNGDPAVGIGNFSLASNITSDVDAATNDCRLSYDDGDNRNGGSEDLDVDPWPCGPVLPKGEDDVAPSNDDNSSTTSGDSCSNCGYLSSGSPAPNHQHGVHSAYPHYQANNLNHRYRSINSSSAAALNLNLRTRSKMHELALKHNLISEQDPRHGKGYVLLSTEERRTLIQEGLPVPTKLPLSKQEEEALKIVRRKIKNKLSAQESRRKRKEYMETLEQQIEGYQSENTTLRRRIDALEKTNQSLLGQLKKLQQQFVPNNSPTSATALLVGNGRGSSSDDSSTSRGGSNVHHTVSLAAVFLLFAVMIPAMPVWPSVFRNAFIANTMISKNIDDVSSLSSVHFDHSGNSLVLPTTRVLSSGSSNNGDCEIPYSAEYFEKLNECRQDDFGNDRNFENEGSSKRGAVETRVLVYFSKSNFTTENSEDETPFSSTAVCETLACREALAAKNTVANA